MYPTFNGPITQMANIFILSHNIVQLFNPLNWIVFSVPSPPSIVLVPITNGFSAKNKKKQTPILDTTRLKYTWTQAFMDSQVKLIPFFSCLPSANPNSHVICHLWEAGKIRLHKHANCQPNLKAERVLIMYYYSIAFYKNYHLFDYRTV